MPPRAMALRAAIKRAAYGAPALPRTGLPRAATAAYRHDRVPRRWEEWADKLLSVKRTALIAWGGLGYKAAAGTRLPRGGGFRNSSRTP